MGFGFWFVNFARLSLRLRGDMKSVKPYRLIHLPNDGLKVSDLLRSLELDLMIQAIERTKGNKSEAAKLLGILRTTLIMRLKSHGLTFPKIQDATQWDTMTRTLREVQKLKAPKDDSLGALKNTQGNI